MKFAAIVLAAIGFTLLALRRAQRREVTRGSTLTPVWWWSVFSWTAIALAQSLTFFAAADSATLAALRWIAAVGACCPLVAVLGAWRPQYKAWQWIVLSLWAMLSLPAAQTIFVRPDRPPAPHVAMGIFLAAVALAGVWNGFRTRYFLAALATSAGQCLLLAEHFFPTTKYELVNLLGMTAFVFGWAAALAAERRRVASKSELDVAWLEFRDAYGGFWAARVLDRMNASGRLQGWGVELTWNGFRPLEPEAAPSRQVSQTFANLLRRFVSPQWIAARLGPDLEY